MKNYKLLFLILITLIFPLKGKGEEYSFDKEMVERLVNACRHNSIEVGANSREKCEEFPYELKKDEKKSIKKYKNLCAEKNKNACYLFAKSKAAKESKESLEKLINDECLNKDNLNACLEGADGRNTYNKYWVRACQLDEYKSCYRVGKDALSNRDSVIAKEFLEKACEGKEYEACFKLARSEGVSKNDQMNLYAKVCDGDFEKICEEEGKKTTVKFEDRGPPGACGYGGWNNPDAKYFFGCDRIKYVSCSFMAEEELIKGNLKKAGALSKKGCDKNESYSCTVLGIVEGKKGNKKVSEELLKLACSNGNEQRACDLIPGYRDPYSYYLPQ